LLPLSGHHEKITEAVSIKRRNRSAACPRWLEEQGYSRTSGSCGVGALTWQFLAGHRGTGNDDDSPGDPCRKLPDLFRCGTPFYGRWVSRPPVAHRVLMEGRDLSPPTDGRQLLHRTLPGRSGCSPTRHGPGPLQGAAPVVSFMTPSRSLGLPEVRFSSRKPARGRNVNIAATFCANEVTAK